MENPTFKFALTDELIKNCQEKYNPKDFAPCRSDPEATGWDVRCAALDGIPLKPESYLKIPLGFRVFSPPGWWLKLVPRSSTMTKRYIHALYGTIDETYEGQVFFCGQYLPDADKILTPHYDTLEFGDRIGQLIPVRRVEMNVEVISNEEFNTLTEERNTTRKSGGFGSTGS